MDLTLASAALVVSAPVVACAATAVAITMGRPVLFRQERVGQGERRFRISKVRTMRSGRTRDDADRITPVGRFLRKTSIDELPQLLDVLTGRMSLVGPRPHVIEYVSRMTSEQRRRHEVLPGLTGWAQIQGRNALSWDERLQLDLWYVENWSPWLDMVILVRTVRIVAVGEGTDLSGAPGTRS